MGVFGEPDVQIAAGMLGPAGAEVDVGDPLCVLKGILGPKGGALIARGGRGEDDLVGEDFGLVRVALQYKVGYPTVIAGAYPGGEEGR